MSIFSSWFPSSNAQRFLSEQEKNSIVAAIREAETRTSGEIRVFIESKCAYVNPVDRAAELFFGLKMDLTKDRNAVLVYIAANHRQYALFADQGIYQAMGQSFWHQEAEKILQAFSAQHFAEGVLQVVQEIGDALQHHFPYDRKGDKNELPDDIVFGR